MKKSIRKTFATLVFATAMTGAAMTVPVRAAEVFDLSYDVSIGVTNVFKIDYNFALDRKAYKGAMVLKPRGLAKLFANISMNMRTYGKLASKALRPTSFTFKSKKKGKSKARMVAWKGRKMPETSRSYKLSPVKQASLAASLSDKVLDPLSAFLRTGIQTGAKPCSQSQRVYDGGKIYDLKFALVKKVSFGKNDGGVYQGPAYKCIMRHFPVAGYSAKKLRKAKKHPVVFSIWFAPVSSPALKRTILVPVAAAGKYKGRNFTALTSKAMLSGVNLSRYAARLN